MTYAERPTWATLALSFLLSVMALSYGAWFDYQSHVRHALSDAGEMAHVVADRAGSDIAAAAKALAEAGEVIGGRPGNASRHRGHLLRLLRTVPSALGFAVADVDGRVTYASTDENSGADVSFHPYFQRHARGERLIVSPVTADAVLGEPMVMVSARLEGRDGDFRGVAAIALKPEDLTRIIHAVELGQEGEVAILDLDGHFVVRSPFPQMLDGPTASTFSYADLSSAHHSTDFRVGIDGVERVWAWTRFGNLPLIAVVGVAHRTIISDWLRQHGQLLLLGAPILLLIVASLIWTLRSFQNEKAAGQALVAALGEREMLLAEVHHRVKNNLQIVQSLLTMEALSASQDARPGYEDSLRRIQAMGMVHELLYQSGEFGRIECRSYLEKLCALLVGEHPSVELAVNGDEAQLDLDQAIPFAMAVTEIVSNALKHGFPDGRSGRLAVRTKHRDGLLTVSVCDNGIGLPTSFDPVTQGNLGTKLLLGLARQLGGKVTFESAGGTSVLLSFPLG